MTLIPHLQAYGLDARIGLLARGGAFDGEINPARVLLTRLGARQMGRVFLTRPALDGTSYASRPDFSRILTGIPLVPLHQLDLIRQFRPHVVMSCTHSMNLAALLSTRAYGRRRVAWILREGINTRAIIESDASPGLGRMLRSWVTRHAYRQPDRVLAISHGVADGLVRDFLVPRDRLCVIHNPVDVSRVSRKAQDADGACPPARFIMACGRLHRQKGFDLLLQAFARLGMADLALVILGEGPERSHLESMARELGIEARVVMPGFVANPWHWMARAAAFVLPSRYEGFGSVLVEAMVCGTPVVATDCEYGPREILSDGEAGLLARAEDIDSLTAAIGNVLARPGFARELAVRGRRRALEFDAPVVARQYADLVRETAGRVDHEGRL
ncbi:MAG: glycosyltransferase [Gammaproteobacteria bacterium]|nr:glycosyltransferase [Gammaproteobacteria bacterium]